MRKGLVEKLPHPRRYRLLPNDYSICLVFLKLFERVYAPLTAGLLSPIKADAAGIMQVTIWKSSVGADQDIQSSSLAMTGPSRPEIIPL